MAVCEQLRCVSCGRDQKPERFGLNAQGDFDLALAQPNELTVRRTTIGGRGKCAVERFDTPPHIALGIRKMLRHRLAQVEADLRAAGVELPDD